VTRCAVCGRACQPCPVSDPVPGAVADWLTSEAVCQRRTCQHALDRLDEDIDDPERMEIIRGWEMYTTPGHDSESRDGGRRGRQTRLDEFSDGHLLSLAKDMYRAVFGDSRTSAGDGDV